MAHDPHTPQFEDHTRAIAQGRPLTYTPEQLHAVHQIVAEGGNPLTDMHDLPRWEDEVGIDRIINRRVMELDPLPTPAQVLTELPLDARAPSRRLATPTAMSCCAGRARGRTTTPIRSHRPWRRCVRRCPPIRPPRTV